MESIDRVRIAVSLYPALRRFGQDGALDLDSGQPIGGRAPPTQAELVRQTLDEHAVRRTDDI